MSLHDLTHLSWTDAKALAAREPLGLVPTGALEQHGPHLPLMTDMLTARHFAERIAEAFDRPVVVAPVFPLGLSQQHTGFPGTATTEEDTFRAVARSNVAALRTLGVSRIAMFSGHGGNFEILGTLAEEFQREGHNVIGYSDMIRFVEVMHAGARAAGLSPVRGDIHAGLVETSQVLAIDPSLVRPFEDVEGYVTDDLDDLLSRTHQGGTLAVSSSGVLGDPRGASAGAGEAINSAVAHMLYTWIAAHL
jgi:creatinine amidohydrolase